MNWNDRAYDAAYDRYGDDWDATQLFEEGARWQRDQLRTDEVTERAAKVLHDRMHDILSDLKCPGGGPVPLHVVDEIRRLYRANAVHAIRVAVAALLGKET